MIHKAAHGVALTLLLCAWPLTANAEATYRYHRSVVAPPGWARLVLPSDVLDKSRPQLNDVRIFSGTSEVPYALEESLTPSDAQLEFTNVESTPGRETTALLDRGQHPNLCSAIELFVTQSPPYLKPLLVESSDDRVTFAKIAQSSIFATAEGHNRVVGFAPNDKRYIRIRLDDRLGSPVHPTTAILRQRRLEAGLEELAVKSSPVAGGDSALDTYTLELPASNLLLASVGVTAQAAVFARNVRVYETVVFRGELSRRLIREGTIRRAPGGEDNLQVPIDEVVGRRLEVEIERATVPLAVDAFTVRLRQRALLFVAPATHNLDLAYGSATASTAKYDLGTALASASPSAVSKAGIGPVRVGSDATDAPSWPRRGQTVDVTEWQRHQAIQLPAGGAFAYLDLPPAASDYLPSVRIVDPSGAQVPYVVEAEPRRTTAKATFQLTSKDGKTRLTLSQLSLDVPVDGVGLVAAAPEFFERDIQVTESITDARGEMGHRTLAQGPWKRAEGDAKAPFWLSIDRPSKTEITITIDDGDNAALEITEVLSQSSHRRIDFAFSPGEKLALVWENPNASAPRYDIAIMANTIVTSPASPATLGPIEDQRVTATPTPKWFWWAASAAGLILTAMLARTLLTPASKDEPE